MEGNFWIIFFLVGYLIKKDSFCISVGRLVFNSLERVDIYMLNL